MAVPRWGHTATRLIDGRVLIVGPLDQSAELFDPATGMFSLTGNLLSLHGHGATATRLNDGRVLIAGGINSFGFVEIFDPVTGTFSRTGNLNISRYAHSATLLSGGKVLIAGGNAQIGGGGQFVTEATAEIFDPAAGTFTLTGSLDVARASHGAVRLFNGKVLLAGGTQITPPYGYSILLGSAELFDPSSGTFSRTGDMINQACCVEGQILGDGKALVLGGHEPSAELFDPATGTFGATGNLNIRRAGRFTVLNDGRVLVVGGVITLPNGTETSTDTVEAYDSATESFTLIASLNQSRWAQSATLLKNGQVLAAGGYRHDVGATLASAELFSGPSLSVAVDIMPGGFPNTLPPRSQIKIPVAILTDAALDASVVDPTTVRFGVTPRAAPANWALQDVDDDGDIDLILQFRIQDTGIVCGTTVASLNGETVDGRTFSGSDSITTPACR